MIISPEETKKAIITPETLKNEIGIIILLINKQI